MTRHALRLLFAAVAVAPLLAGCDIKVNEGGDLSLGISRGRASDEWTRSYTLDKGGRFEISNENGAIEVKGGTGPQVTVKAFREVSDRSDEGARARLAKLQMREDVSPERVTIRLDTGDSGSFGFNRGVTVRYEVEVPAGLTVAFKTQNGAVRLDDVEGRITAGSTNGTVTGRNVSGAVQASTVNGSVQMDLAAVSGDVRLTTVNGAVRLELPTTADADLDATTVNGGVSVDDRLGLADVSGNRGEFGPTRNIRGRLNKGGAQVSLQTTNGGVRVAPRGAGGDNDDEERGERRRGRRDRQAGEF